MMFDNCDCTNSFSFFNLNQTKEIHFMSFLKGAHAPLKFRVKETHFGISSPILTYETKQTIKYTLTATKKRMATT